MSDIYSEQQYRVHLQSVRETYVRINWLDFDTEFKTDETTGLVQSGDISLNGDSSCRRTGNLKIALIDNSYLPNINSHLWVNRKCSIELGIRNIITNEIVWFNKGNFIINEPKISISNTTKELSLNLLDFMCNFDGTLSGTLNKVTKIVAGTPIQETIKMLFSLGGCTKFLIDNIVDEKKYGNNPLILPYTIEKQETETIYNFAKEIKDLYMGYEMFFNEQGYLVYRKIRNKINDMVKWEFNIDNKDQNCLITSYDNKYDFHNIRNHITVIGRRIEPLVATPSSDKKENNENTLSVYLNKPLYIKNNDGDIIPLKDKTNVKNCFSYTGTQSNYIDAVYTVDTGYMIKFTINGEHGKCLNSIDNKLFDSSTISFKKVKFEFSSKDNLKWSVPNFVIIDYTNNVGQFINNIILPPDKLILKFNKPLYDGSGNKLNNNTDVKSYFSYNGAATNYISAIYITDEYSLKNEMRFQFTDKLQSSDELTVNPSKIYDSAAQELEIQKYIFDGIQWYQKTDETVSDYQIQCEVENNIKNHPFSVDVIGRRSFVIRDDKIFTPLQAKMKGDYELRNHSNFKEECNLSTIPIYMLDANDLVYIKDSERQIEGKYCIKTISVPLSYSGNSSISCYKIYDENTI